MGLRFFSAFSIVVILSGSSELLLSFVIMGNRDEWLDKIEFLPFAFGANNEVIKCEYWDKKIFSKAKNLSSILDEIDDKITVVKCDCEGCEWDGLLDCSDFKNVRMIDLEYHLTNTDKPLIELVTLLKSKGFDVNVKEVRTIGMLYAQK